MLNAGFSIKVERFQAVAKYFWTESMAKLHKPAMFAPAFFLASLFFGGPADAGTIRFGDAVNKPPVLAMATVLDWLGLNRKDAAPTNRYQVSAPIGAGGSSRDLPEIHGPADARLPLVVIDAGHGGHDPGAISPHGGQYEKHVTLAIARAIRDELVKTGRVRVALTREGDSFIVLQERYSIARKLKADLFMSIHADSAENQEARGGSVYTLSEVASDREAQRLASRENKADIINGVNLGGADVNVSSILIDLTQRETMNVSAGFAKLLLREAEPNLTLRGGARRFASFIVLKAPDTPSVLFETGYLSNAEDASFLGSADGQRKVARSVSSAVQAHFARRLAVN
jgi:N-acetylmuramoyl-L-alanine amidase